MSKKDIKPVLQALFLILLFTATTVLLYATVFNSFNWYIAGPLSAVLPLIIFMVFGVIVDSVEYLKRAVQYMKAKKKEKSEEREGFRHWFYENHDHPRNKYSYEYQEIAEISYMIDKLEEEKECYIKALKETQEEEKKIRVEIDKKLEGEG